MAEGISRAERKQHTRALLVGAARRRVAEGGYAALTVREMARAADIVPTAFYRHFASVEELAAEVAGRAAAELRVLVDSLVSASGGPAEVWPPLLVAAGRSTPEVWPALSHGVLDADSPAHEIVVTALAEARRRLGLVLSRAPGQQHLVPDQIDALADVIVVELLRVTTESLTPGPGGGNSGVTERARRRLSVILG